jgi:SAM-dependent methyltransferase
VVTCPFCGGPRAAQLVYKHRWWRCERCGNASRELRERLPLDGLPAPLRGLLPRSLRVDRAIVGDPARQWFVPEAYPSADPTGTPYAGEVDKVRGLLRRYELDATGAILDLSGGPGFVARALAATAHRVVMTDFVPHIVSFARDRLGVDACFYDYDGPPLPDVVRGPFDLVLSRYSLNFCVDLPRFVTGLNAVTTPGAVLLFAGFLAPSRGALLTSALEDAGPRVLWAPEHVSNVFAEAGWETVARFETDPPMRYWTPRSWRYRLFSLPWELGPGAFPRDVHQYQPGMVLRRA